MLYDYIIIYDYKTEGRKKEMQQLVTGIVPLKGHLCTLFTPRSFIVVHIGSNVHLFEYTLQRCPYKGTIVYIFEYTLQRCPYKGTIVYIFHIVFCVCCMYST